LGALAGCAFEMSVGGIASILPSKAESMGFKVTDCGSDY
jgi:hypothetical protein